MKGQKCCLYSMNSASLSKRALFPFHLTTVHFNIYVCTQFTQQVKPVKTITPCGSTDSPIFLHLSLSAITKVGLMTPKQAKREHFTCETLILIS